MKHFIGMLVAMLLMLPLVAIAGDFNPLYDKDAVCFMSLNYKGIEGPAPKYWEIVDAKKETATYTQRLIFIRLDGEKWLAAKHMLNIEAYEYLPCFIGKTAGPAWLCPQKFVKAKPVVTATPIVVKKTPKVFTVYFDFDKSNIRADQVTVLEEALEYAQAGGIADIKLSADCDFRGSDDYNIGLGQRRADAVAKWFAANGLDLPKEVDNNGKGRSTIYDLINGKFCKQCWADRKVEITVE